MRALPLPLITGPVIGCWRVTRKDGAVLLSTELDADVTIASGPLAGTYLSLTSITGSALVSSSDLAVDNMEASGTLAPDADYLLPPMTAAAVEAGLFDGAEAIYLRVNWREPDAGQIYDVYTIGNIKRDTSGQWTCELRSLTQRLAQIAGEVFSLDCRFDLGDHRCQLDVTPLLRTGAVAAVIDNKRFEISVDDGDSGALDAAMFVGGTLTFESGDSESFAKEIKAVTTDSGSPEVWTVEVWENFPRPVAPGDTVRLRPDCLRQKDRCKTLGNFRRFGGFPHMPGPDALTKLRFGPTRTAGRGGGA